MSGRRVFVTGATGLIGRELVRQLVDQGEDVVALCRSGELPGAETLRGSLEDADALRRGCEGAQQIFHLAGGFRGPGRVTPDRLNHLGTKALLEACTGEGRVVLASSAAVYGDRSGLWVEEDFPPSPHTRYGRSKVDAEQALTRSGRPAVIARIGAVYGRGFPLLLEDAIRQGQALLPGEGTNHVPTLHVQDCAKALILLANEAEDGGVYHLADRSPPTAAELYAEVLRHVGGRPVRFWSTWVPSYVQLALARNNERLQSRLGLRPRFTPDSLRLLTASVRLKVDRLEELGFRWSFPDATSGLAAIFSEGGD